MFGRALMAAAAVVAIALSTGTLLGSFDKAEAGKPELIIGDVSVSMESGNCVLSVDWSGVRGGKKMWVTTRLNDDEKGSAIFGTTVQNEVRQDEGHLEVVYPATPGVVGATVSFDDNRRLFLGSETIPANCS